MAQRKVFQDSVTPLPDTPGPGPRGLMVAAAEPETANEEMNVLFSLEIPAAKTADLEERVARGEVLSPDELQQNYAPNAADRDKLVKWLNAQGFDVTGVSHDGSSVYARASVAQIEKSLDVDMVRVTKDGVTYTAAKNAPSLPSNVANGVHAIIGLQPFRQARKQSRMCMPHNGNRTSLNGKSPRSRGRRPAAAAAPVTAIDNAPPYIVPEILKAYGADGLNVTGKGQTIAILIDTFPADSDLKKFWANNNVPASVLGSRRSTSRAARCRLPPVRRHSTSSGRAASHPPPRCASTRPGTLQFVDLDRALDRIIADLPSHPGMRQLSISLGLGEKFMGGPNGEVRTQHHKFLMLAAAGVNVFVSSGDAGSKPDDTGHGATGPTQAEYESSDSDGRRCRWHEPQADAYGCGEERSRMDQQRRRQEHLLRATRVADRQGVSGRPDAVGARRQPGGRPGTGAFLVLNGQVVQMGGTSWSAPVWAGFCALLNEARSKARKPFLPFLNPLLYPLQGTACFRDIRVGQQRRLQRWTGLRHRDRAWGAQRQRADEGADVDARRAEHVTVAVLTKQAQRKVQQVINDNIAELRTIPGFVAAEPGFPLVDGTFVTKPAIIVLVRLQEAVVGSPDEELAPHRLGGYPVHVMQADPLRQLQEIDAAAADRVVTAAAATYTYKPIEGNPIDRPVTVTRPLLCHVGPDAGWPVLQRFLQAAKKTLSVAIYDFNAAYIAKTLIESAEANGLDITVNWDNTPTIPDESDTFKKIRQQLRQRFRDVIVQTGSGRRFANSYHEKVAVRDSTCVLVVQRQLDSDKPTRHRPSRTARNRRRHVRQIQPRMAHRRRRRQAGQDLRNLHRL